MCLFSNTTSTHLAYALAFCPPPVIHISNLSPLPREPHFYFLVPPCSMPFGQLARCHHIATTGEGEWKRVKLKMATFFIDVNQRWHDVGGPPLHAHGSGVYGTQTRTFLSQNQLPGKLRTETVPVWREKHSQQQHRTTHAENRDTQKKTETKCN